MDYQERNDRFVASEAFSKVGIYPFAEICVVTCLDPRTDPASFLELGLGEATVLRNAGGRVNEQLLRDLEMISFLSETKVHPDAPLFEIMIVHHNQCGTHFLAEDDFRAGLIARAGGNDASWLQEAVVDPESTVRVDVAKVLADSGISRLVTVSGHVYDVTTGRLREVVARTEMPHLPV